jgi:ribosomal protein S18 acetylase RimI-like enzyme
VGEHATSMECLPFIRMKKIKGEIRGLIIMNTMQSITQVKSDKEKAQKNNIWITFATLEDVDSLVALHYKCFSEKDHIALRFGKPFMLSTYRWFVESPDTFVVVAKQGDSLIGFQSVSDRPYDAPMLRASWREALIGLLSRPWLAFHPELLGRLRDLLFRRHKNTVGGNKVAQLAFIGVDPKAQGMGIGKAIINATISACRERGMRAIITGVKKQNLRSIAMLEGAGLVKVPELETNQFIYLRLDLDQDGPSLHGHTEKALETDARLQP